MSGNLENRDYVETAADGGPEDLAPRLEGVCWPTLLSELRKPALGAACVVALSLASDLVPDGFEQGSLIITGSTSQADGAESSEVAERERLEREAHWRKIVDLAQRKQREELEADAEAGERLLKAARGRPPVQPPAHPVKTPR
jgi:hypothetical protein